MSEGVKGEGGVTESDHLLLVSVTPDTLWDTRGNESEIIGEITQGSDYDGPGAVTYVVTVLLLYSFSIVLFIAYMSRRTHENIATSDKEIQKFLIELEMMRRRGMKEKFREDCRRCELSLSRASSFCHIARPPQKETDRQRRYTYACSPKYFNSTLEDSFELQDEIADEKGKPTRDATNSKTKEIINKLQRQGSVSSLPSTSSQPPSRQLTFDDGSSESACGEEDALYGTGALLTPPTRVSRTRSLHSIDGNRRPRSGKAAEKSAHFDYLPIPKVTVSVDSTPVLHI